MSKLPQVKKVRRKLTMQDLYDGLQSRDFEKYVDLVRTSLNSYLDNCNELCWHEYNDETLEMIMEGLNYSLTDLIRYTQHSKCFNVYDDFVRVNVYGHLETITYRGLADLYEELLFDENYLDLVEELLEEISL